MAERREIELKEVAKNYLEKIKKKEKRKF